MALKELQKSVKNTAVSVNELPQEIEIKRFIDQGGDLSKTTDQVSSDLDHRLTLRIPQWLMDKVDIKRKERVGKISRNLWILEIIEKATQE